MIRCLVAVAAVVVIGSAAPASAQMLRQPDVPRRGSWEIGGGAAWATAVDFGERRAQQTRNPTTGTGPLDLFVTDSTLEASPSAQAHLAFYVTPAIAIEAGVRYAQPRLRTRIMGDFEEADDTTAEETMTQYQFDGSLVLHLRNLAFADRRAVPFVLGGAGHIRDLHERDELVETGTAFHGGAGVKWWFGSGQRRLGMRIEGRVTSREGGFNLGEKRRTVPSGGVSLAYLF